MQINTGAIINGEFADRFGKRGSQFSPNGMPTYSIPFDISDAPAAPTAITAPASTTPNCATPPLPKTMKNWRHTTKPCANCGGRYSAKKRAADGQMAA